MKNTCPWNQYPHLISRAVAALWLIALGFIQLPAALAIDVTKYPVIFAQDDVPQGASTHLPSIYVTTKGTVLAVCQLRKGANTDFGHDIDLLLRRSLDGGKTWEPVRPIYSKTGVNAVNGPIVQDRKTGLIILPFTVVPAAITSQPSWISYFAEHGSKMSYITSSDEGKTWSEPQEVVPSGPEGWCAWAANSSHGIQLASGRLVIGAFVHKRSGSAGRVRDFDYCAGLLYSDDGGKSWRVGATAPIRGTDEIALTEAPGGEIYANIRLNNRSPNDLVRYYARSRDNGETFYETGLQDNMSVVNCHVGLVRCRQDDRDVLAYSGPQGAAGVMKRSALTVRLSYDGGRTWPVARMITGGNDSSGYSDLAATADGTLLCLYGENTFSKERSVIRLVTLPLAHVELDY